KSSTCHQVPTGAVRSTVVQFWASQVDPLSNRESNSVTVLAAADAKIRSRVINAASLSLETTSDHVAVFTGGDALRPTASTAMASASAKSRTGHAAFLIR